MASHASKAPPHPSKSPSQTRTAGSVTTRAVATHRVPDLKFDLTVVDVDHARAELNSNGEVVHWLESLVRELEEEA